MANRELVVLGTASQAPTRTRNHNGYFLHWDDEGLLFDPGEGTQRQMLFAGVTASQVTRVCLTHFHGDHCLGLPGVLQRMSLDRVAHAVEAYYPGANAEVFGRLRHASLFNERLTLHEHPVHGDGVVAEASGSPGFRLEARALSHLVPAVGYRLVEPDGRRMLPAELAARGIAGSDVGRLRQAGRLAVGGGVVTVEEVSVPRLGQRFAFVMDTRLCDAAFELADGADMLVCESTFADADAGLARDYGHLTARQAGQIAAAAGARLLVLTHFSQRYETWPPQRLRDEAAAAFSGEIVLAADLDRIPVPSRAALPPPTRRLARRTLAVVTAEGITLVLRDGAAAAERDAELLALRAEVCDAGGDPVTARQPRVWRRQPGYVLAEARHGGYLVAFASGLPLRPSTSWWRDLTSPPPGDVTAEYPGRTFALTEFLVRASWRRQGIGRALHDLILDGRPEERATVTVPPGAAAAQAAFRAWGWRRIARTRGPGPGIPVLDVLVTGLPAR